MITETYGIDENSVCVYYAYPSSPMAKELGRYKDGAYYVTDHKERVLFSANAMDADGLSLCMAFAREDTEATDLVIYFGPDANWLTDQARRNGWRHAMESVG